MKHITAYIKDNTQVVATLNFEGGFTPEMIDEIPKENGIYAAFACKEYEERYECRRLIYLGKAEGDNDNIHERFGDHIKDRDESDSGKQSFWEKNYLAKDEKIVYSYAMHKDDLADIESALIRRNQPEANIQSKDSYTGKAWHEFVKCQGEKGTISEENSVWKLLRGSK